MLATEIYTDEEVAQKPHYCEICSKRFSKEDYFKMHMKIHSGELKIKCDYCDKEFQDPCYLKRHIRTSHTHKDEKPFKCAECGRAFKHRKSLKSHSVIHTNVNPYECQDCGDTFRDHKARAYHYCQTFMNSSMWIIYVRTWNMNFEQIILFGLFMHFDFELHALIEQLWHLMHQNNNLAMTT